MNSNQSTWAISPQNTKIFAKKQFASPLFLVMTVVCTLACAANIVALAMGYSIFDVFTKLLSGNFPSVEAAFNGVKKAGELIDMRQHHGAHPRSGATDVLPLIPISGITLDECAELARGLAEIGKKTLFIDADMRKSVVLKNSLKAQNIKGLSELLSNQATIEDVLYNTQLPCFDVIFCGHFPPNPVELLSSSRLSAILDRFKSIYDYIIIDTPPLDPVIDAAVIASHCDGAILVVGLGKAKIKETTAAKEQLIKSGCKILGAVVNEPDSKQRAYSSKKYSSYYGDSDPKSSLFKK